jgi:hypothetical protein
MRVHLAFAAITAVTLITLGCQPVEDPCKVASGRSATFAEWVREASVDGANGPELTAYCRSLLVDGGV